MNSSWEKYFIPSYNDLQEEKNKIKESVFFGGICLLIAMGLILHLKKMQVSTDKLDFTFSTRPALFQKLEILDAQNSILESEIINLKHRLSLLLEEKAKEFVSNYNSLLAINEYNGEGVIVKINDSTKPLTFGENPNLMIIHNLDLLSIVNELWGAGAKAISVNDQRIISTSEFNCIGPIILINNSKVLPPFSIKAVGDPEKLYDTVSNGYIKIHDLEKYGITYLIKKEKNITIPASSKTAFVTIKGTL